MRTCFFFSIHENFHQQWITCLSNLSTVGRLCLFCAKVLCLKQQAPLWERRVENKSSIHMQVGSAVRLPFVFFSLVGWPFSREYEQDMLTLHAWDTVPCKSRGFRLGNKRSRRVPEGAGCSLFWVFLFNPITVSVCADWASTSQVMCLLWKVGQHSYRHWKCDAAKATAVCFIWWDRGKMNYTVSRISSRSVLNKKGGSC